MTGGDAPSSGRIVFCYTAASHALAWLTVLTNTPPRSAQIPRAGCRGLSSSSRSSRKPRETWNRPGRDSPHQLPRGKARWDHGAGKRQYATSAFLKEGSTVARSSSNGTSGSRVRRTRVQRRGSHESSRVGVSLSCYVAAPSDSTASCHQAGCRITFQSGIGNLGTESVMDVHRAGGSSRRAVGKNAM